MHNRLVAFTSGAAAVVGSLFFLSFQVELDLPWQLMIGGLMLLWLGGLIGLWAQARAGRLGRLGLGLAIAGVTMLFLSILIPGIPDLVWELFIVVFYLIPGGLILYGFAALQTRSLGWASFIPLVLGVFFAIFLNTNPAWPLWIESTLITLIGLGWLIIGFQLLLFGTQISMKPDQTDATNPIRSNRNFRHAIRFSLVLLPFLVVQGLVWNDQNQEITCPAANPLLDFSGPPRPVIIDVDMAHEDMHAVLYLLQHPAAQVQAITVVGTGEAHCEPGVRHAQGLAALHGEPGIPIACGPETPLQGDHEFPASWREEVDNLYGLELPPNTVPSSTLGAPKLIAVTIQESPIQVSIIAVGPLTNVALALEADPTLINNIAMIYVMGGAVELGGNVGFSGVDIENPVAEWNIYADPHAANIVFQSGAPVTLVPLNATRHAVISTDFYRCIQENHHTPEAAFVYDLLRANYGFVESGGFQFWDSLTAAIFTDESLAAYKIYDLIVVEQEGPSSGQTRLSRDGYPVRVATSADGERFKGLFLNTLNGDFTVYPTQ